MKKNGVISILKGVKKSLDRLTDKNKDILNKSQGIEKEYSKEIKNFNNIKSLKEIILKSKPDRNHLSYLIEELHMLKIKLTY